MRLLLRFPSPARFIALLISLASVSTGLAQSTIYVRVDGPGTDPALATSWSTALSGTALQGALASAPAGTTFLVGAGLYKPSPTADPSVSFRVPSDVQVYGGYAASGPTPEARTAFPSSTTLSGEGITFNVVRFRHVSTQTRLDGFVITGGNALGAYPNAYGGGIYNDGSGGGNRSNPTLSNLVLVNNTTGVEGGGTGGGGLYNDGQQGGNSSPQLINVLFEGNSALGTSGGAMLNNGGYGGNSSPQLTQVTFRNNIASSGGAIANLAFNNGTCNYQLTDVLFEGNSARGTAGAIYNYFLSEGITSNALLTNVRFVNNIAEFENGGGMYTFTVDGNLCTAQLTNVSFVGNRAAKQGGAIYTNTYLGVISPQLTNVSFVDNQAETGGAIYSEGHTDDPDFGGIVNPQLTNTVVFGNGEANSIVNVNGARVTARYSLFEASVSGYTTDPTNVTTTTSPFVSNTDPQLRPGSPAIDTGLNEANTTRTDVAGKARIVNGRIDLGAYEYQSACPTPITITQVPASQTACVGTIVSFSVQASGPQNLTYAWYKNSADANQPVLASTPTYSVNVNEGSKAGRYIVRVSAQGCESQQAEARLSVNQRPVAPPPTSTQRQLCPAQTSLNLGQFVSRTNPSYSLRYVGPEGQPIVGSSVVLTQPGSYAYQAIQVDPVTGCESVSTRFTLTVGTPTALTQSPPPNQSACSGSEATLSVRAVGSNLKYEWFRGSISNANKLFDNSGKQTGTTTASLKLIKVSQSENYFVRASGECGMVTGGPYAVSVQACGGRQGVAEAGNGLQVKLLGNPVEGNAVEVEIRGVAGQGVALRLVDQQGKPVQQQSIHHPGEMERASLPVGQARGVLLLEVYTARERQRLKVLVR